MIMLVIMLVISKWTFRVPSDLACKNARLFPGIFKDVFVFFKVILLVVMLVLNLIFPPIQVHQRQGLLSISIINVCCTII